MTTPALLLRRAPAIAVTAIALAGLAWLSAAPVPLSGAESARLRLSLSARPERIETCRVLSSDELAKLGEHMRQRVECEGKFASYQLRVSVDGSPVHESVVRGAGLRSDRPIYLLEDFSVNPGTRAVHVSFRRREHVEDEDDDSRGQRFGADTGLSMGRAEREDVERARRARAAIPRLLELDTALTFTSGQVIVVTLDPENRALQVLAAAPASR
ncbi:MAG: hypothetical protein ACSLFK_03790 [Gemmatimonadaceae bacterium]